MARLAEVCVTPAKPLGNRATKFAFVFYEFHPVDLTILNTSTYTHSSALTTNQIFFLVILVVILGRFTILHTSKVGLIAFETLIVREALHRVAK